MTDEPTDLRAENGKWAHVICDSETHEPTLADDCLDDISDSLPTGLTVLKCFVPTSDALAGSEAVVRAAEQWGRRKRHEMDLKGKQQTIPGENLRIHLAVERAEVALLAALDSTDESADRSGL